MQLSMTPGEVDAFLRRHWSMALATFSADGFPHVVAMAYVMLDGSLCFWGEARSQKMRNLRRDPRLGCLVEEGDVHAELRGVSIAGEAELYSDPDDLARLGRALLTARFGHADESQLPAPLDVLVRRRVGVRLHPLRIASWDHAKA